MAFRRGDERCGKVADGLGSVCGVELDLFDDGGADNHAVGGFRDFRGLLGGGDAEADADRGVGELADGGDLRADVGGGRAVGTGDAGAGKQIDEAFGRLCEDFHALRRGGRRDQADVFEARADGKILVERGFVGREVEQQDAVGSGGGGVVVKGFEALGENGSPIGEEHDGRLVGLAEAADQLDGAGGAHAGFERALGGHLVDDAVG